MGTLSSSARHGRRGTHRLGRKSPQPSRTRKKRRSSHEPIQRLSRTGCAWRCALLNDTEQCKSARTRVSLASNGFVPNPPFVRTPHPGFRCDPTRLRRKLEDGRAISRCVFLFSWRSSPTSFSPAVAVGVMVAQGSLEPLDMVRVHDGQPFLREVSNPPARSPRKNADRFHWIDGLQSVRDFIPGIRQVPSTFRQGKEYLSGLWTSSEGTSYCLIPESPAQASKASPTGVPVIEVGTAATIPKNRAFLTAILHRSRLTNRWMHSTGRNTETKLNGIVNSQVTISHSSKVHKLSTTSSSVAESG